MKTYNNFIEITENSISKTEENDIINFTSPLSITDDSRQWNMTKYDIPSLDISHYDGLVTVNHGQDIADVVGKVINLRKDEQGHKVLIDGIKFAVNSNPVAILAKNLMKDGFVTGVSIETLGGEADQTGTWLGHKLCGLSIVAHPNNLNAYATIGNYRQAVANSIQEAQKNGLDTSKIENAAKDLEDTKSIYFFDKKNYNNNMETAKETVKKNSNRLSSLLDKVKNGGVGSGNHNPGQGRGVGKPGAGAGGRSLGMGGGESKHDSIKFEGGGSISNVLPGEDHAYSSDIEGIATSPRYSKYGGYTQRVGYSTTIPDPFVMDPESKEKIQKLDTEYEELRAGAAEDYDTVKKAAQGFKDDKGWSLYSPSVGEIEKYMSGPEKETALKARQSYDEKQARMRELNDEMTKAEKTASYYPNQIGTNSAILLAAIVRGAGNYNGQRSDGAGESSFNDNVKRDVDNKSQIYQALDEVLRNPLDYSGEHFTNVVKQAASYAKKQASYLKRVENSINEPNFMNSTEFRNAAMTIEKLTQDKVMSDQTQTYSDTRLVLKPDGGFEIKD